MKRFADFRRGDGPTLKVRDKVYIDASDYTTDHPSKKTQRQTNRPLPHSRSHQRQCLQIKTSIFYENPPRVHLIQASTLFSTHHPWPVHYSTRTSRDRRRRTLQCRSHPQFQINSRKTLLPR